MKGFEGKRGEVGNNGQTGQPGRSGKDGENGLSGNDGLIVRKIIFSEKIESSHNILLLLFYAWALWN